MAMLVVQITVIGLQSSQIAKRKEVTGIIADNQIVLWS
jgi:hypothetical protein